MATNDNIFNRLKRFFSSDVVVRNIGGRRLRVVDIDSVQKIGDRRMNDKYTRLYSTLSYGTFAQGTPYGVTAARLQLFRDYEVMDMDAIISAALDVFSEESTLKNEMGYILRIKSGTKSVREVLENLFYDIMNIEFNLPTWVRGMCKYGDYFLYLDLAKEYGVTGVMPLPVYEVTRLEGIDPKKPDEVKFVLQGMTGKAEFEKFQVAHFRLNSDSNFLPYGKCLRWDSKVWTSSGIKNIKDVEENDEVFSFDYNDEKLLKSRVIKTIYSGRKEIYKIKTAHQTLYATESHPIMTEDGKYKLVSELTVNDHLMFPVANIEKSYPKLIVEESENWKYDSKLKIIDENILKDNFNDFVRFFGFMIGDGWLDKSNKTVCFSIGDRLDKSKKYLDFIEKLGINYRLTNELKSDSSCVVNSVYFYKLFEQLGFITGSFNKEVPEWIWRLDANTKKEFLYGFADADGCDISEGLWQIGTVNYKLMQDSRALAVQAGFSVTRTWGAKSENKGMCLFTFREKSRDYKKISENYAVEKVQSIEYIGKDDVYDIQIDNSLHNFVAEGFVVHNSIIEGARRVWKQLILMEDAMLIHRIMRAPEKRVFKIDVGNLAPNEVDAYMEVIMNKVKKIPYIDESTGEYNLKFNMQNITEDFYLPVRGGDSGTSIESLAGLEYNAIDDIAYLKDKLMAALKVPKAFLGYEEALNCIVPETKIPLLNGKTKTVAELIKDYENGITNYAYSINQKTNSIVPGKITWAGFTRKNAELVRVKLDNEKYIDCTSDHKFLTRDGRWVEAKDLLVGQSLMPLYLNETDRGYSTVYQPNNEKYKEVHRVVAEHYGLVKKGSGCVVHHKDFTKENNYPENFDCSMDYWGHRRYHQNLKKGQKSGKYINCESCGKSFYTYPYRDRNAKYCSYECYHNDMKTGENRKCVCCGKEFWAELGRNRKYCSFECSCKDYGNDRIDNIKYTKVQYENLLDAAKNSKSFKELRHRLGLTDIKTLYKLFDRFGINKETFICENMLLAMNNKRFIHKYVLNHKVVSVEFLTERKNTCDITIEEYSNFATDAGVIVHNSKATLASQDVRFSRTVERLQKVIISELTKIALVHLFIQGFKGSDLVDFELELTIPSIIYEQEKVELWNSKISLARDAKDTKMRSTYWIYKNIFNMTEDEIAEEKEQVVEDAKLAFRLSQIETEGNDPAKTDQTFGGEETDEAGRNEKFNLNYDKTESSGSADKKKEEYEPVNPSDDGRRGKKLRTRDKDEPFGDDPLGQRDYEKILKLDTQLNYDANKNKHLSRRLKHAEAVLGRRLITTSKPDILKEFEGDFEIKLKDFFSESKTKPKENKEVNNNENDE